MKSLFNHSADVVIVDDDEDDRLLMDCAIDKLPINVAVRMLPGAHDVLDYLQECQYLPSLLITDLNMPCINGLELLSLIKQSTHHRSIPVVILTTSASEEDRERCFQAGASAVLVKPHQFLEMTQLLHSCLQVWLSTSGFSPGSRIIYGN